jgi:hypothetical protein
MIPINEDTMVSKTSIEIIPKTIREITTSFPSLNYLLFFFFLVITFIS